MQTSPVYPPSCFTSLLALQAELWTDFDTYYKQGFETPENVKKAKNFNRVEFQGRLREINRTILNTYVQKFSPRDLHDLSKLNLRIQVLVKALERYIRKQHIVSCFHEVLEINMEIAWLKKENLFDTIDSKDTSQYKTLKERILFLSLPEKNETALLNYLEQSTNRLKQAQIEETLADKFSRIFAPSAQELKFSPPTAKTYEQVDTLVVSFSEWTDLSGITRFTNLRELKIRGALYKIPMRILQRLPKLEVVDCYDVRTTPLNFKVRFKPVEKMMTLSENDGSPSLVGKQIPIAPTFLVLEDEPVKANENQGDGPKTLQKSSHIPIEFIRPAWYPLLKPAFMHVLCNWLCNRRI